MLTFPAQLVLGPLEFLLGNLRRRLLALQRAQVVLHPSGRDSPPQKADEYSDQQSRNCDADDSPCHEFTLQRRSTSYRMPMLREESGIFEKLSAPGSTGTEDYYARGRVSRGLVQSRGARRGVSPCRS